MRHRASNITKILSLFRQRNRLELSEIAATLLIPPSTAKDYCHDLVKSGMIFEQSSGNDPMYIATEKLITSDSHIYEMIGDLCDDIEDSQDILPDLLQKSPEFDCIMSVGGYCGDAIRDVPCDGKPADQLRCYRFR